MVDPEKTDIAATLIRKAKYAVAFTGAGISAESGILPFRGENGLWNKMDPIFLEIEYFNKMPLQSWRKIKEFFYDALNGVKPNSAHKILAKMEKRSFIEAVITQNIDHLHQQAGCLNVVELHGTYKQLICTGCRTEFDMSIADLNFLPPTCFICKRVLKPNITFFNESIPDEAKKQAFEEAGKCDLLLIIGTNAEVLPAADIPVVAKKSGAKIIEINIEETHLTKEITDIFLQGRATEVMKEIGRLLYL
ncbi:MAG: NAD-dependent protein deacylase [Mariniphaga sp.]|jgi:NAD-dependent deacetylase